jgi:hypothetical protein
MNFRSRGAAISFALAAILALPLLAAGQEASDAGALT